MVLVEILNGADVVPKSEGTIVVDDSIQIVLHASAITRGGAVLAHKAS